MTDNAQIKLTTNQASELGRIASRNGTLTVRPYRADIVLVGRGDGTWFVLDTRGRVLRTLRAPVEVPDGLPANVSDSFRHRAEGGRRGSKTSIPVEDQLVEFPENRD